MLRLYLHFHSLKIFIIFCYFGLVFVLSFSLVLEVGLCFALIICFTFSFPFFSWVLFNLAVRRNFMKDMVFFKALRRFCSSFINVFPFNVLSAYVLNFNSDMVFCWFCVFSKKVKTEFAVSNKEEIQNLQFRTRTALESSKR